MRNPSGGHGQGRSVDRTTLDAFVRDNLASSLMTMQPKDGVVADDAWCLADDRHDTVLLYSLASPSIRFLKELPSHTYKGVWFDPRTGGTQPMKTSITAEAGGTIGKPTTEPWLLLLRDERQTSPARR